MGRTADPLQGQVTGAATDGCRTEVEFGNVHDLEARRCLYPDLGSYVHCYLRSL